MDNQQDIARFVAGFRGMAAETQPLGPMLLTEFSQAERDRQQTEQRWLMDLRQYRGIYEPDVQAKIKGRSNIFGKKTRTKVRAVNDRIYDLLFPAGGQSNFRIEPTPEPEISGDAEEKIVSALKERFNQDPSAKQLREAIKAYATTAAGRMQSTIEDQLIQVHYRNEAKKAIHDGNLYGTGIIKAPLVDFVTKERFAYKDGTWAAIVEQKYVPFLSHVPLWRFFPDMQALDIKDCRYVWERHRLTKAKLQELARNPSFDGEALMRYSRTSPSRQRKDYEQEVESIGLRSNAPIDGTYELLERWGWIDTDEAQVCGCEGMVFANVWLLPTGEVVKFSPQPVRGMLYPYHFYYYDRDESTIFAEGLAAIMRDEQAGYNAARRAAYDNMAITAGPQMEIFVNQIDPRCRPQQMGPFYMWWRTGGENQYPAVRAINFDSHVAELSAMAKQADMEIDEVTALPKYLYGDNPNGGAAATASGMSMLMGQANIGVKAQVQSFDDGVTTPLMEGMVAWNMQFNSDPSIKGDFAVKATGSGSLVAKEVRTQVLAAFTANLTPMEQQFVKWDRLAREKAKAADLQDIMMSQDEIEQAQSSPQAQQQAQLIQAQTQLQLANAQAAVLKLEAEVQRLAADAERLKAQAMKDKAEAAYASLQAGGAAAQSPNAARAGDEILRSIGWLDAQNMNPMSAQPGMSGPMQAEEQPASPFIGQNAGIETQRFEAPGAG